MQVNLVLTEGFQYVELSHAPRVMFFTSQHPMARMMPALDPALQFQIVSTTPRIFLFPQFLSHAECDYLIETSRENLSRSVTIVPDTGENYVVQDRTSSGTYLQRRQNDIITAIEERIALITGIPLDNGEGLQILNYQIGQEYRPHFDFFDPALKGSAKVMEVGGQRLATFLMYLNDVEEGGETIFPEIDIQARPVKGSALLFYNCHPDGEIDRLTLHGSNPVIKGEKWVSTKWIRERHYG